MCRWISGCLLDDHMYCGGLTIFCMFVSSRCPSELGLSCSSSVKVEEIDEGAEPAEFLEALGQQDKKAYDCMLQGLS